jgi:SAM-dependent methyltransferase
MRIGRTGRKRRTNGDRHGAASNSRHFAEAIPLDILLRSRGQPWSERLIDNPRCPVCEGDRWARAGQRTYAKNEMSTLREDVRDRYRVLFEVWCRNLAEFTITSQVCQACGIAIYTPRPSAQDVDEKYEFLQSIGSNKPATSHSSKRERRRAVRVFQIVRPHISGTSGARILDFGGADGRLMQEFADRDATCHLIDRCETAIPGVVRIGSTEDDIPVDRIYDAIVCNHVLEHLAEPFQIVEKLAESLKEGGILYAEVPMEIWKRPPLPREPVTHINFFTPASLSYLMYRAGLRVKSCRLAAYPHPNGLTGLAIVCIAEKNGRVQLQAPTGGLSETQRFLKPSLYFALRRRALMPSTIFQAAARKLRLKRAYRPFPQDSH